MTVSGITSFQMNCLTRIKKVSCTYIGPQTPNSNKFYLNIRVVPVYINHIKMFVILSYDNINSILIVRVCHININIALLHKFEKST